MGLSNRNRGVNSKLCRSSAAGCIVVFAFDIGRRMTELAGTSQITFTVFDEIGYAEAAPAQ